VIAAVVAGSPVTVAEVDAREAALRASPQTAALPRPNTSEGRQLRRWLTQILVTEKVVAVEAASLGVTAAGAPGVGEVLPDLTARLEIGSIAAAALASSTTYAATPAGSRTLKTPGPRWRRCCAPPPGGGPSGSGWNSAAPRWSSWRRATSTPATPASPTTSIGTDRLPAR